MAHKGAANLTLGDRATISNMAPEFGATAAMFYIDPQTIKYLKLTGRDDALVALVETYAKQAGLWADSLAKVQYERVLTFDLSSVVRNIRRLVEPAQARADERAGRTRDQRQSRKRAGSDA